MRPIGIGAMAVAAVLGSSAMTLTSHASTAGTARAHASSHAGTGGRAAAAGGNGGAGSGGTGIACSQLDLSTIVSHTPIGHSNDVNNLGGGQLQLGDGANLLGNLFLPALSPRGAPSDNLTAGASTISDSQGADDSADTGNASCGNGHRGGTGAKGGSASGGNGGKGGRASAH